MPGRPTKPKTKATTTKARPKARAAAKTASRAKTPARKAAATRYADKRAGRAASPRVQQLLDRLRAICLALPQTTEVEAWGHPTFRVNDKIFGTFGGDDTGAASMGVKTTMEMQSALVASDPRFKIAPYVGKHGWVHLDLSPGVTIDWNEIEVLVRESYRMIAPAKLAAAVHNG